MSWATKYLGLPYEPLARCGPALDCWGLFARVYRDELGIVLPLFDGLHPCAQERAEIGALLTEGAACSPWRPVDDIRPFDALLFRRGAYACHVGVAVTEGRMLHSDEGGAVIVSRLAPPWRNRFIGAYRHEASA